MPNILSRPYYHLMYTLYQRGSCRLKVVNNVDLLADAMEIGDTRRMEFRSGSSYRCRLVRYTMYDFDEGISTAEYEMSNDIQELTFSQFLKLAKGRIKLGRRKTNERERK